MDVNAINSLAIIVAGAVYAADRFGLLPKRKSTTDAVAEIELRDAVIDRVTEERDKAIAKAARLEQERSNEPVLMLVNQVFETQQQTLDKLAHFNGALKRNEEGLREATEALKMIAGLVIGVADIPVRKPEGDT